ncbi:MAG: NAD-dependent epimerase/dehydratase family protein [Saprospiraceae bacterium]|nr:NAD-dependent epimerase/dehydratase family protein [Saprospiraceae bacterium]
MKRILITGGAGFIGSSLADELQKNSANQIVLVDNLLTGKEKNIPHKENVMFIKADVNEYGAMEKIMLRTKFDYVFHYAAVVGVQRTLDNPIMVLQDIDGIKNILELSRETGVQRVFFSSSSEVYGEPVNTPQHEETTPLNSRLPYAVVKNLGESFCRAYHQAFGLDYTIFRFFNTYGEKQSDDFVISKFIRAALEDKDITIYGDGSQSRTFCYIEDNVEFTRKILEENLCINEVVNVGNDHQYSIAELADMIVRVTNSTSKIVYLPPLKEGDMTRRQPDISKMRSIIKRDLLPLEEGLARILKSWKAPQAKPEYELS